MPQLERKSRRVMLSSASCGSNSAKAMRGSLFTDGAKLMNRIIYIVGLVVVVVIILSLLGIA